ncbi:germin-like protein 1 [Tripterygium wilfordii]|uniref:Germin-like protein n=1 Tax=Tripterygium wilfordii TaxID=458696 RepID=A0A7J7DEY6_TRIWF|nr:germin-like protein 9-3 [Tripterygium wilfordii]KAF5744883.1 germin-like protein 1 [Tripterygium wilfordii]
MASNSSSLKIFLLLVASFAVVEMVKAGDADILSDFLVPPNTTIDGGFFTYIDIRKSGLITSPPPPTFKVTKVSMAEFPALNGQSVSYAILQFPVGATNPPHTHPRAAELLFVVIGSLEVGFVDTTNKLYTQTLQTGDMFIFPKGLVHFQYNADSKNPATAISAFGSASAGTVSLPATLFLSNIDDNILAKSFKTDEKTIQALKTGLAPKS